MPPFSVHGEPGGIGPVIIAVPHGGRHYEAATLAQARVPAAMLARLEDRLADLLARPLIEAGHCVLVAHAARATIDLNRDENEIDPAAVRDWPRGRPAAMSAKVRGGLGLLPTRLAACGGLWRGPLDIAELDRRLMTIHRPYHATLARLLETSRTVHGAALLIDLHSMPPLAAALVDGDAPARLVVGDRFGRSASPRLAARALDVARAAGLSAATNHPYPGGHVLDRHGKPWRGVHAVQVELDRTLYLDAELSQPGPGLAAAQRLVTRLVTALAEEFAALSPPRDLAAAE